MVYENYSCGLRQSAYFKMLKKYMFKLQRAEGQLGKLQAVKADTSPELQVEKVLTKVICAIMNGFARKGLLPDASKSYHKSN